MRDGDVVEITYE